MITNIKKEDCLKILNNNYIGHLAYVYKNSPFVIPITYYYDKKNLTVIGYTGEGHKTKALRANNAVALEIAEIQSVDEWKSILIQGTFEELEGSDAKYELHKFSLGVKKLIKENENKELQFIPEFSGKTHFEALPIVYHINIQEITGKQRKSKSNVNYLIPKKEKKFGIL
ncbi:pyridoxamine 5'-phosphate oxidase family protein [Litoribaculum gwangyangense]|uniref:Flavin mononucleotide-binding protein n=1 Tax=Litoribaculum gwangyangense TaxID=1130722 RepID=A0ABP9CFK8_9FLAO